jgi:hypothetical protein
MTTINCGDRDLHDQHGHISTPPSTKGRALAAWEKRIARHLAEHRKTS